MQRRTIFYPNQIEKKDLIYNKTYAGKIVFGVEIMDIQNFKW